MANLPVSRRPDKTFANLNLLRMANLPIQYPSDSYKSYPEFHMLFCFVDKPINEKTNENNWNVNSTIFPLRIKLGVLKT